MYHGIRLFVYSYGRIRERLIAIRDIRAHDLQLEFEVEDIMIDIDVDVMTMIMIKLSPTSFRSTDAHS